MLKRIHNSIRSLRYGSLLSVVLFFALVSFAHAEVVEAVVDGALKTLGNILYPLAHMLGSVIVGLGGLALNMAIQELIIGWGSIYLGNFGTNIQQIWVIIRDLFNILFIFSFIFLGIKTILNAEDSSTRRAIGHLIVAALFINFSLFIALAVIDFSNVIATQIYNQLIYVGVQNEAGSAQGDISGAFMEAASIGSFFANPPDGTDGATILFYAIFMLIFFIVTGIIFLFGTYHVMYRFVVLSLCLILSPVLFLGMILPNFKKFSDKWIETLLRQSFFAPAFLFLLYVSLQVLMTLKSNFGGVSGVGFTTILQGKDMSPDAFTVFLMFGLTIGFLYAAVKVGDTMGIAGAKTTLGALGGLRKGIQNTLYRPVGAGLNRWGVGGIDKFNQTADSDRPSLARTAARVTRTFTGGRAGYEAMRGTVERAANFGGRDTREKAEKASKLRSARGNELKKITSAVDASAKAPTDTKLRMAMERAVQSASSAQIIDLIKEGEEKKVGSVAGELSDSQFKAIMDDKEIDDATKSTIAKARASQIADRLMKMNQKNTIEEVIGKADTSELKALGFEKAYEHAGKLSAKQIDDWKDLTPTEKTRLKAERKKQLIDEYGFDANTQTVTGTNATAFFGRITNDEERSKLPNEILKDQNAAQFLNKNVLTKIVDNSGISATDRASIKSAVIDYHLIHSTPQMVTDFEDFFNKNNAGQRY